MIVEKLKTKYQESLNNTNYKTKNEEMFSPTIYLFSIWAHRVPPKWYGFSLQSAPFVWGIIIDEFLTWMQTKCPDFKILQCKIKYGSLRFYTDLNCSNAQAVDEVMDEIRALENWLQHKDLIY